MQFRELYQSGIWFLLSSISSFQTCNPAPGDRMPNEPENPLPLRERYHLPAGATGKPPGPPGSGLQAQPSDGDTLRGV